MHRLCIYRNGQRHVIFIIITVRATDRQGMQQQGIACVHEYACNDGWKAAAVLWAFIVIDQFRSMIEICVHVCVNVNIYLRRCESFREILRVLV